MKGYFFTLWLEDVSLPRGEEQQHFDDEDQLPATTLAICQ